MRIIAGSLGGRNFDSPRGHRTHPMSDKVRGALFNALGDIGGLSVLDAFAGSGAIGFEAVSRGAKQVTAIEIDSSAQKTIQTNIVKLGLQDKAKAIRANVISWSANNSDELFDIIVCDPPFDQLQLKTLQTLVDHLTEAGVLVLSWPGKVEAPTLGNLKIVHQSDYGDAQLVFYKRTG